MQRSSSRSLGPLVVPMALSVCWALPLAAHAGDGELAKAALQRVKKATTYLRVTLADGQVAQGSGFFGVEPNIVLTNAHVLGMLRPEGRRPKRIEVIVSSGEPNEKSFPGEVLGVDRSSDLAVIRVAGQGLPEPLKVVAAANLVETQPLYVFGFPFGAQLGKNITVSRSSVSSLRKNAQGILNQIQVNGGMHPGNSGGPVVDQEGNVVGVAQSVVKGTQLHFAVPGDYVHVVLNGRITGMVTGQPYRDAGAVRVPITLQLLDPLQRLKKVELSYWMGNAGKPRPSAKSLPQPAATDSKHLTVALAHVKGRGEANVELTLPPLEAGKVYWLQPSFVNGAGAARWQSATVYVPGTPVERADLLLQYKQPLGSGFKVDLTSSASLKMRDHDGADFTLTLDLGAEINEAVEDLADTDDNATAEVRYQRFNVGLKLDGKPLPRDRLLRELGAEMRALKGELRIDPAGGVSLSRIPDGKFFGRDQVLYDMHMQVLQSLQAISVPLPNKKIAAGQSWQAERQLWLSVLNDPEKGRAAITYTYIGMRKQKDRTEAVIELTGSVRGLKGKGAGMTGKLSGTAIVDAATGQLTAAQTVFDLDLDTTINGKTARLSGTLAIRLRRTAKVTPAD